ncbi:hypothetical protein [Falsiruegeria mediterranea]|uniref:Phage major tail protein 2 n=1 Tax=Falsiruegeria mediterranea M17 TaxID=1200281 RepID=A0A2R8C596_9RHOB|nr:hypothetical protein [Falsiruegeria mediterranea]SPJ27624.1 hypothetical protein TRM7615_01114 [Falsiruegeria mediterranea M17]
MAENVIPGDLVTVKWSATEGGPYTTIKGCKTVGIPEVTPEYRDRTSLDSPGRSKEYGPGLEDTSELTLSCYYSQALYEEAAAFKASRKPVFFEVQLPPETGSGTGDKFEYKAFVTPSLPTTDYDGDLMTDLKLRPTGEIAWTKGAA